MADRTEFNQSTQIVDPKTGLPTQTFLQKINNLMRLLDDLTGNVDGIVIPSEASDANVRAASTTGYVSARRINTASADVALTDAATVAVDWATGIEFTLTVTASSKIGNPTNGIPGTFRTIIVQGNSTTDRTITFDTQFLGDIPTITDCDSGTWYALYLHCITSSHFAVSAKKVKG